MVSLSGKTPVEGVPRVLTKTAKPRSLVVLHSPDNKLRGRIIPIDSGVCIGRSSDDDVDLAIDDRLLSRRHATISPIGSSAVCELVDHESRNGSFVEGMRIQRSHLTTGNVIRLGVTLFELSSAANDAEETLDDDFEEREAFLGRSRNFRSALTMISKSAVGEGAVTIVGESGTGKKRAAKRVHLASGRRGRFIVVHCGTMRERLSEAQLFGGVDPSSEATGAEGFVPMAVGGTLLFDEVDLLSHSLQEKLLEMLNSGKYRAAGKDEECEADLRVVASSGASLSAAVNAGAFSKLLHEKLSDWIVEMPALRDRRSDIPLLARHFLKVEAPERNFDWSTTCLEKLLLYDWPGNIRQMQNVMRRLTLVDDDISTLRSAHLPKEIRRRVRHPTEESLRASAITVHAVPSRDELARLLTEHDGDVALVADHYAKDRRHVYRWLLRHDLNVADFRK
jgi:two-component system response regulator GlrR